MIKALQKNFELIFWIMAIVALAVSKPGYDSHFILCPIRLMGFKWCPGCGIGHAISWLLHGKIKQSLHAHWLGIPALLIIFYRVCYILYMQRSKLKSLKYYQNGH